MNFHEAEQIITMEHANTTVIVNKQDLTVSIQTNDATWKTNKEAARLTIGFDKKSQHVITLQSALTKQFSYVESGTFHSIQIKLEHFLLPTEISPITVIISVQLNTYDSDVIFQTHLVHSDHVAETVWPGAFSFNGSNEHDYTVLPAMQGYILPATWDKPVRRYHGGVIYDRDGYMPWWGQVKNNNGYIAIIETADDARLTMEHIPHLHSEMETIWIHSLGNLRYNRKLRYRFQANMNYVTMAKIYRNYVKSYGNLKTLQEKIATTPQLAKLQGSAIVHTSVHTFVKPVSDYYDTENLENNDKVITFAERAEQLVQLKARYGQSIYVHVDGWGLAGYDNQHPDVIPPSPRGGGYEGMKSLQNTCKDNDILFAIHDNYRDFYHDAASYNDQLTIKNQDGSAEYCDIWAGGAHSFLCTTFSKDYVQRNYNQLAANNVQPDGVYIDVFAVVPGDECYDPAHMMSRTASLEHRASCFEEIRARNMIISSEEPADWAIPHLDLVHHAPYALYPGPGGGPAMGIPVPLFSLVYHDTIVVPWSLGRGDWGIPEQDLGYLHGLLHGGVPYLSIEATDEELNIVRLLANLHATVGTLEMTNHSFVDNNYRRQLTTFANGTIVEIDLDEDTFVIVAEDGTTITSIN
ncbi:DUF5696 domain-containing protein [Paenibacillus yanchengensis]|uniref:DUF5696 domain-containing protein n=1 Tax=Paenibacillus yanchengensis TaxID=2035833 RepID=A0ABW4YFK2_9BACL